MPHCDKQMVSLFLTTKCNLNCAYCYNAEERVSLKEATLPFEIAKAGIDYFFSSNPSRHVRFYGPGEPTQALDLMDKITRYAKTKSTEVTIEVQTNGVFNSKAQEWLLDNANIVWISFDGPPDIQDINRPIGKLPSSPVIEKNVFSLNKYKSNKDLMVGARVTMTNDNIFRQKEMVDYFSQLGITQIWTDPIFHTVDHIPSCNDPKKLASYSFDMDAYVDNYIESYYYAQKQNVFYGSFLTCNFDGVTDKHCRACTPNPHFTPDGYISACDLVTFGSNAHHMSCFVYGKWNPTTKTFDIFEDRLHTLQQRTLAKMNHCINCIAREHCGGYCLGEVVNETGSLFGQKPAVCAAIRKLFWALGTEERPYRYMHP